MTEQDLAEMTRRWQRERFSGYAEDVEPKSRADFDPKAFGPKMSFDHLDGVVIPGNEKTKGLVSPGDSGKPVEVFQAKSSVRARQPKR